MQIKFLSNLSLKIKTIIGVIILIICVAFVFSFVYIGYQRTVLLSKLEKLGSALAGNLAFNSELGVYTRNLDNLRELSEGVSRGEDIIYVSIFTSSGELLVYNERNKRESEFNFKNDLLKRFANQAALAIQYYKHLDKEICQISAPVKLQRKEKWIEGGLIALPETTESEVIGEVVIGLSLDSVYKNLTEVRILTLKYASLIIFIAALITFFLVSMLTRPIKKLMDATSEVSKGNFDIQLKATSSDEVGALTASFNHMVKEVKEGRDKIEASNKELARLNNEMEEILHIVSHDLRSPLINVQGFSQRLDPLFQSTIKNLNEISAENIDSNIKDRLVTVKKELEEKFPVSMRFISKGVAKMDTLLSALLAVSRVGRKADPIALNDLNQLLGDVLLVFDHQLKEKGIDIIRRELPAVPCRRNEINQVFSNLLSNAINYMKQEPPKLIEIGCVDSGSPDYFQFFVKDSGIGIKDEDHDKLFKMFSRLGEVDAPGEGIGLAYVQKIIRSHKGKIWFESKKGTGTTFYFTLPKIQEKGV